MKSGGKTFGFTLLEMLVSVAIFTIATFIIMVTLFSVINAQRKVVALQNADDNLRFAFEVMAKEIRTGGNFHCGLNLNDVSITPQNCPSGGVSFTFQNALNQAVTYQINQNQLVKSSNGTRPCDGAPATAEDCLRLTAPAVVIVDRLAFYANGTGSFDGEQSRVTIVIEGQVQDPRGIGVARINLQNTVSKRGRIDLP